MLIAFQSWFALLLFYFFSGWVRGIRTPVSQKILLYSESCNLVFNIFKQKQQVSKRNSESCCGLSLTGWPEIGLILSGLRLGLIKVQKTIIVVWPDKELELV